MLHINQLMKFNVSVFDFGSNGGTKSNKTPPPTFHFMPFDPSLSITVLYVLSFYFSIAVFRDSNGLGAWSRARFSATLSAAAVRS